MAQREPRSKESAAKRKATPQAAPEPESKQEQTEGEGLKSQSRSYPQRIGRISFAAITEGDAAVQEAKERQALVDRISCLCGPEEDRDRFRRLCAEVTPESWPFGKLLRLHAARPERWDEERDLPSVALVLAAFHDCYSCGPWALTAELEELCKTLPQSTFLVEDLPLMLKYVEQGLHNAGSDVHPPQDKARKPASTAATATKAQDAEDIGTIAETKVWRYPLDTDRPEIIDIEMETALKLSWYISQGASRGGTRVCRSWRADAHGRARFARVVRELLVKPGHYSFEELRPWTFAQLWIEMTAEIERRDRAGREQLRPIYKQARRYADRWRREARRATDSFTAWLKGFDSGADLQRSPFPCLQQPEFHRAVTADDLPWMYLVVGLRLDRDFGPAHTFIPEDVELELKGAWQWTEKSIYAMACYVAPLSDLEDWWHSVKEDILKREETERSSTGCVKPTKNRGQPECLYPQHKDSPSHDAFVLEVAERAAKLLVGPENRAFIHDRVKEFVARVDAWDARIKTAMEEWQEELGSGYVVARKPTIVEASEEISRETCFMLVASTQGDENIPPLRRWIPIADNPWAMLPPYAKWGKDDAEYRLCEDDALIRDCTLVAIVHDRTWPAHQPVYFYRQDDERARLDEVWVDGVYRELLTMPWAKAPAEVDRAKAFIQQSFRHVEAAAAGQTPPTKRLPPSGLQNEPPANPGEPARSWEKAARLYDYAIDKGLFPDTPTDDQVYDYLHTHQRDIEEEAGEKIDLPSLDTFKRYLRRDRKARDQQKHRPRAGREGGSIAPRSDL